jgi:TPR repeat protein
MRVDRIPSRIYKWRRMRLNTLARVFESGPFALALVLILFANSGCQKDAAEPVAVVAERISPAEVEALRAKGNAGDTSAQARLGRYYVEGMEGRPDYKEAAKWCLLAAEHGDAGAQVAMGDLIEAGQGVAQDHAAALKWYRAAADQGSAKGQYALAVMHQFGRGVAVNQPEAAKWYLAAGNQGDAWAQFSLGQRYELGVGVARDYAEAYKWFNLAAAQSLAGAREALDRLAAKMESAQISDGNHRASIFAPQKAAGKPAAR